MERTKVGEIESQVKKMIEELKVDFYRQSTKLSIVKADVNSINFQEDMFFENSYDFMGKGHFYVSDAAGGYYTLPEEYFKVTAEIKDNQLIVERVSLINVY